ncbi:hypothetical protein BpHYR1_051147 [Brachionus plicatilis]|uniref:Uncharacterized protein n=1 Tax=Brachionus plicatilis TaxID=10195 RepID=A0A3M7SV68_BRAPC|nr:hypothetical protein BpHYR1_051147 [Brachionus plicatilis]
MHLHNVTTLNIFSFQIDKTSISQNSYFYFVYSRITFVSQKIFIGLWCFKVFSKIKNKQITFVKTTFLFLGEFMKNKVFKNYFCIFEEKVSFSIDLFDCFIMGRIEPNWYFDALSFIIKLKAICKACFICLATIAIINYITD